jgi:hypothetical protein
MESNPNEIACPFLIAPADLSFIGLSKNTIGLYGANCEGIFPLPNKR